MERIDDASLEDLTRRPLLLPPNRVFRLWRGGAVLDRFQGRPHPEDAQMPEEWVGSTTVTRLPGRPPDEGLSHFQLPDGRRLSLRALIEAFPEAMLGEAHVARFGRELSVLCKLLDSAIRNFIQAHPDRAFARRYLGSSFGKTEAWIVLATRVIGGEEPYILLGFKPGVSETEFRRAARDQDTEALVDAVMKIPVHPGEVYLLGGGAPHALGPGVFLVEIQEPTDFVVNVEYRLFGRTEEQAFMGLPFDRAMECFNYAAAGPEFVERHRLKPRPVGTATGIREEVLIADEDTAYFGASRMSMETRAADRDRGRCYIGIVIAGGGMIEGEGEPIPVRAGTTFFVPAASRHTGYRATEAPLTVIKCFPPHP